MIAMPKEIARKKFIVVLMLPSFVLVSEPLQPTLIPEAENVADSEDSEDEWNYYRIDPNKEQSTATTVVTDESHKGVEEQNAQDSEPLSDKLEIQSLEIKDIECEESQKGASSPELINIDVNIYLVSTFSLRLRIKRLSFGVRFKQH